MRLLFQWIFGHTFRFRLTEIKVNPNFSILPKISATIFSGKIGIVTNHFRKNFNYIRKRFDVTQDWLASQIGKSQSTIGGWGQGVSEPSIEILIKISGLFGISIDYLLTKDLETHKVITDQHVKEFAENNKVTTKPIHKVKAPYIGFDADKDAAKNSLNDPDLVKEWTFISILKQMDAKLDQLLISGKKE